MIFFWDKELISSKRHAWRPYLDGRDVVAEDGREGAGEDADGEAGGDPGRVREERAERGEVRGAGRDQVFDVGELVAADTAKPVRFLEAMVEKEAACSVPLEVDLPRGVRLRISDAGQVPLTVQLIRSLGPC